MSNTTRSTLAKTLSLAGFALAAGLASQPALAFSSHVSPRAFQAYGHNIQLDPQSEWRKANGAEILGGFAGADDEVNARTGEVRSHR
jgi:hypothetical protein